MELGLDEREAAIEGMILIDLRTEVGSKKTAPDAVGFVSGSKMLVKEERSRPGERPRLSLNPAGVVAVDGSR